MPIYEYNCKACGTTFEEWHRHADDIREQPCPKCHKAAKRLISNTSFVLKGGGWYVTEYGNRKSETKTADGTPATPVTETAAKPEASPPPATAAAPAAPATS